MFYGIVKLTWASVDLRLVGGMGHRYMFVKRKCEVTEYYLIICFPFIISYHDFFSCLFILFLVGFASFLQGRPILKITENKQGL